MERRKFVIGVGSLAAGGAAAMGTGAFSAAQLDNRSADIAVSNDANALIQLLPGHHEEAAGSDSTVPDDRVGYEDGELFISFTDNEGGEGVNPNSVYQVGAIGEDGQDNLESNVDGANDGPDVSEEILYGGAGGTNSGSGEDIKSDPAFVIRNESDQDLEMTLSVDETETPNTDEFTAAYVLKNGDDEGGFTASAALGDDPEGYSNFTLDSGNEISASLIVVAEEIDPGTSNDFEGSLTINAEEAIDPGNEV